tara:strand:- start:950 stop:1192 length:243 start_codon:yes stop_codon:yes gene_type:complete
MQLFLQLLSLALSIFFAYVFITYAEEIQNTPTCNTISPDKRELIKIYGWVKMVLSGISGIALLVIIFYMMTGKPVIKRRR